MNGNRPSPKELDRLLRFHGVELRRDTVDLLWAFHRILVENNGASIFLPAAGYVYDFGCAAGDNYLGYYWTTSISSTPVEGAVLSFTYGDEKGNTDGSVDRYCGSPIRAVWKN